MATMGFEVYPVLSEHRDTGPASYGLNPPNRTLSSSSPEEYSSALLLPPYPLTTMVSNSGTEPSQRMGSFQQQQGSRLTLARSTSISERDSSTWTHTGAARRVPVATGTRNDAGSAAFSRSSSSIPSHSYEDGRDPSSEEVIIEEKRRRSNGDGYTLHRYTRGRMLGKGGFAKVYECVAMDTGKTYAVKIVSKANLVKARARQKLQAEIKIHRTLKHKHVCAFKHYFEDRDNCYILLELCHNQSLNELIKRRKRLTEPEAAYFMDQLLQAVEYMHDQYVIHRDLKLGNLFLDKNLHIKVGDLGLATRLEDKDEKRRTICGTPNYIAPEVIQGDKATRGHSFEVDIWSMGVILYTILIGQPPYEAKDVKATYQRILANEYSFPKHIAISDRARALIMSMLQTNPSDRPSLEEIGNHSFLSDAGTIPASLPQIALNQAPCWRFNEFGQLVWDDDDSNRNALKPARGALLRQPFALRDHNQPKTVGSVTSRFNKVKSERDVIDIHRVVKSAMAMGAAGSKKTTATSSGFKVFDESEGRSGDDKSLSSKTSSKPSSLYTAPNLEDSLVKKAKALSLASHSPRSVSASSSVNHVESDVEILRKLVERLEAVLEITASRQGTYRQASPKALTARSGPPKWVTRYVDYTSKYGLGFLLNDGTSGVYFNDSTKAALEAEGETFQYMERRKFDDADAACKRTECLAEKHTLSNYPETLKKKVTLLTHFRDYLLEQQKKADHDDDDDDSLVPSSIEAITGNELVYVKKWVRTKHAILFRLSDQTIQVVFYDQTEILFTPDFRDITYVDKCRKRATYNFTDELVGSSADLEKRLKYTKEIMLQLLAVPRR